MHTRLDYIVDHAEYQLSVETLTIQECSLNFKAVYAPARVFASAALESIAQTLVRDFRNYGADSSSITLDRGDELFRYALRAALFNRLVSVAISADALECNFSTLPRASDRQLALACIAQVMELGGSGLSDRCSLEIGIHAAFTSQDERDNFFTSRDAPGLDLVGILGYAHVGDSADLLRLEVDQSWVYADAAFISFRTIGMQLGQFDESRQALWTSLFDRLAPFGLKLSDA